jgi:hypothetical protein
VACLLPDDFQKLRFPFFDGVALFFEISGFVVDERGHQICQGGRLRADCKSVQQNDV